MEAFSDKKLKGGGLGFEISDAYNSLGDSLESLKIPGGLLGAVYLTLYWYVRYLYLALLYAPVRTRIQNVLNDKTFEVPHLSKNPIYGLVDVARGLMSFSAILNKSFQRQIFTGFLLVLNASLSVNYKPWAGSNETKKLFFACLAYLPINMIKDISDRIPEIKKFTEFKYIHEKSSKVLMRGIEASATSFLINKAYETWLPNMFKFIWKKLRETFLEQLKSVFIVQYQNLLLRLGAPLSVINNILTGKESSEIFWREASQQVQELLFTLAVLVATYKFAKRYLNSTYVKYTNYVKDYVFYLFLGVGLHQVRKVTNMMTSQPSAAHAETALNVFLFGLKAPLAIIHTLFFRYREVVGSRVLEFCNILMLFWVAVCVDISKTKF